MENLYFGFSRICFDDLDFYFKYDGSESPEKEIDEKDGAKFHRGQPNEIGLVDKVDFCMHHNVFCILLLCFEC